MPYRVELKRAARKGLKELPPREQKRVGDEVEALAEAPRRHGSRKIHHQIERWRVRVGNYRIIYEIEDDVLLIVVIRIGHRREVYRGL